MLQPQWSSILHAGKYVAHRVQSRLGGGECDRVTGVVHGHVGLPVWDSVYDQVFTPLFAILLRRTTP